MVEWSLDGCIFKSGTIIKPEIIHDDKPHNVNEHFSTIFNHIDFSISKLKIERFAKVHPLGSLKQVKYWNLLNILFLYKNSETLPFRIFRKQRHYNAYYIFGSYSKSKRKPEKQNLLHYPNLDESTNRKRPKLKFSKIL